MKAWDWIKANSVHLSCLLLFMSVLSVPVLYQMTDPRSTSDMPLHMEILRSFLARGEFPIYSIYYFLVWAASFFSVDDPERLRLSSLIILFAAKALAAVLVYAFCERQLRDVERPAGSQSPALLFSMALMVMMPIADPTDLSRIYRLHISPNVWHNSTSSLAMPFVVLAFGLAADFLKGGRRSQAVRLGIALFIATLCKPSFTFVFAPVFIVFYFVLHLFGSEREQDRGSRSAGVIINTLIIFLPAALVLAMQFLEANPRFLSGETRETEWLFAPFAVWSYHTPGIPLSLVRSLLLPALILFLLFPAVRQSLRFKLALGVFAVALLPVILLAERSGPHLNMSGNFFWGAHMALFVLMMESLILLAGQNRLKFKPLFTGVIALYVVSGLIYVSRLAVGLPF